MRISTSVALDERVVAALDQIAEREERSRSALINRVMKQWVDEQTAPQSAEATPQ